MMIVMAILIAFFMLPFFCFVLPEIQNALLGDVQVGYCSARRGQQAAPFYRFFLPGFEVEGSRFFRLMPESRGGSCQVVRCAEHFPSFERAASVCYLVVVPSWGHDYQPVPDE